MKIGFLISGIGIYGSVREVVENCNVLTDLGNECYIFNPEGETLSWIECKATVLFESKLNDYKLDVLFLTTMPNNKYFEMFKNAKAKKKIFCFMGFDTAFDVLALNPNLKYIVDHYWLTGDSQWQIDWLKENTASKKIVNAQLGGINTQMFHPLPATDRKKLNIGWSGDMRQRKGGTTLQLWLAANNIATVTYFGKGVPQNEFHKWFNKIDIFIDNHYSGGWCNPVAEAMSCGVPVICSDVLCNQAFAIDQETCLKFPFNNFEILDKQLKLMIGDSNLRKQLASNALSKIAEFDYQIIARKLLDNIA